MDVDGFARLMVFWPKCVTSLRSNIKPNLGCRRNISIYAHPLVSGRIWGNKGHTGVVLVSRCGCLASVIRSPHFLQTTSAYIHDLGRLEE